jgi:hypothetical protein
MVTEHDYSGFVGTPANPFSHTATMTAQRVNPNTITLPQTFADFLQGQPTRTLHDYSNESLCIAPHFTGPNYPRLQENLFHANPTLIAFSQSKINP